MEQLSPVRTTTTVAKGNAIAFALSFFVVVLGLTSATKTPLWIMLMAIGCLTFGWILNATLVTHLTSDLGLRCAPPEVPAEFHAMTPVPVTVKLENANSIMPLLLLTAEFVAECDGHLLPSPPKFVGQLPVRSTAEFKWRLTPRRRGEYFLRSVIARTSFPGSIVSREFQFSIDRMLLALPAEYRLKPQADRVLAGRKRTMGHQPSSPAAVEEIVGVREYRPGDNPRHVSMPLSIRMPDYPWQLVVREFVDPTDDEVCVILDTAISSKEASDHILLQYRFEKAVSFSVALCRRLCEQKHRVKFLACSQEGKSVEMRLTIPSRDVPILERLVARLQPRENGNSVRRILKRQIERSDAIVVFVSLQERSETFTRVDDRAVWLTPEWQSTLVAEVANG